MGWSEIARPIDLVVIGRGAGGSGAPPAALMYRTCADSLFGLARGDIVIRVLPHDVQHATRHWVRQSGRSPRRREVPQAVRLPLVLQITAPPSRQDHSLWP